MGECRAKKKNEKNSRDTSANSITLDLSLWNFIIISIENHFVLFVAGDECELKTMW